jgi:DeoR/GlpR family transcriptional regulator of sugar metabolism
MEADLCRLICQKAKAVYMLLDSSKIGKIKPHTFARLEDINVLVTDSAFPQQLKSLLQEKNVVLL